MIRLTSKIDNYRIVLGKDSNDNEISVMVRPLTSSVMAMARSYQQNKFADITKSYQDRVDENMPLGDLPDLANDTVRDGIARLLLFRGLAVNGILSWENIADENGDPIDPTPELIEQLFENYWVYEQAFQSQYTGNREILQSEKKSLESDANGTSEKGQNTA